MFPAQSLCGSAWVKYYNYSLVMYIRVTNNSANAGRM